MPRGLVLGLVVGAFAMGAVTHASISQKRKPTFSATLVADKDARTAATALLDTALQLAGDGSWERIAVGRAWYLGGDKVKGQQILDSVTSGKKVADSDWFRIGKVYEEAHEWSRAAEAFDKALALKPDDDSGMLEYGALANVNNDRAKAEALFTRALGRNPGEFWHWVGAGGSYLGVKPQ